MRRALAAIARLALWSVVALVALALVVVGGGVLALRTNAGRGLLLRAALPRVQAALSGRVTIARLEGDTVRTLVIVGLEVDDPEGRPAVGAERVTVQWNPLALLHHELSLDEVRVEGGWVRARPLADGRWNVAALARPSTSTSPSTPAITAREVLAEIDARAEVRDRSAHARLSLDAAVRSTGERAEVHLTRLAAQVEAPLAARIEARGAVRRTGEAIDLDRLRVRASSDGAEVDRLDPALRLAGPLHALLQADGPIADLEARLEVETARGTLEVSGHVASSDGDLPRWSARAALRGLDPSRVFRGGPPASVEGEAHASGLGRVGQIEQAHLRAVGAGLDLEARGHGDLTGHGEASLTLAARDLSSLAAFNLPGLAGRLDARAHVRREAHVRVDGEVHARAVRAAKVAIARLDATVHALDLTGSAELRAAGVEASGQRADLVVASAHGDRRSLTLRVEGHGASAGRPATLQIAAHGQPSWRGDHLIGADVAIDRVALAIADRTVATQGPARLRVDHAITLTDLVLGLGPQRLAVEGAYDRAQRILVGSVRSGGLDLHEIAALAPRPPKVPHTRIDGAVTLRGRLDALRIDGNLSGSSDPLPALGRDRITVTASGGFVAGHLRGEATASSGAASLWTSFDVAPRATIAPLRLQVAGARLPLHALRPLLPPSLGRSCPACAETLDGTLAFDARAGGTLRAPTLTATLHASGVTVGELRAARLDLDAQGGADGVRLNGAIALGSSAGTIEVSAHAPVALGVLARAPERTLAHLGTLPIQATVRARGVALGRLPVQPRPDSGTADATVELSGTVARPAIDGEVAVRGLAREGSFDHLDGRATIQLHDQRLQALASLNLRGGRLLEARGEATIDLDNLATIRDAPAQVEVTIPGFDLSRLRGMRPGLDRVGGQLRGRVALHGTAHAPVGDGDASATGLALGDVGFREASVRARFDGQRLTLHGDATASQGGTFVLDGSLPIDPAAPLAVTARAKAFDLRFLPRVVPGLGQSAGTLDAQIAVGGTRRRPTLDGAALARVATLRLADNPREYEDVILDLTAHQGTVTVRRLHVASEGGSFDASGSALLDGLRPQRVDGTAKAKHFSFIVGSTAGFVDADLKLHGEGAADGLHGTLDVVRGDIQLPHLGVGGRKLQPLGPLEDVVFTDRQARRERAAREAAAGTAPTVHVVTVIPGPFHLRSRDARTDVEGKIELAVSGPMITATGHLQANGGSVELLGQRYDIDRARLGFGGSLDNPEVDIRLTRVLTDATIALELSGTVRHPRIAFSSDPPRYDQSQILGIVVSGDPSAPRVSDRTLDQKVTGAVSNLVLGRLKDAIAPSLPIDVLHVETGNEGYTGLTTTRVELGKYITEKIYVSYVHQFNAPVGITAVNSNEAHVEYRFLRRFELDTSFGDAGVGGLDLFWAIRY